MALGSLHHALGVILIELISTVKQKRRTYARNTLSVKLLGGVSHAWQLFIPFCYPQRPLECNLVLREVPLDSIMWRK